MLLELKITNFLLIESAHFKFDEGLIVFTGETGAGKSLLVKALRLLLGEKGGASFIKPDAKEGEVEALIWGGEKLAQKLKEIGYSAEEEIHIKRVLTRSRQRTYLNGSPITLNELSLITRDLINLTSQHEFYQLLSPEKQLQFLDDFLKLFPLLKEYSTVFFQWSNLKKQIQEIKKKLSDAELKKDFLMFQIKELEELNPSPVEEAELLKEREKLKNLSTLKETLQFLTSAMEEGEALFSQILSSFEKLSQFEEKFKDNLSTLYSLYYELKEAYREVVSYFGDLPEDDARLDEIEERLAKYEKLKRKYKTDTQGLVELLNSLKNELSLLETGEEDCEKLLNEEEALRKKLLEVAEELSKKRVKGAPELEKLIEKELRSLGMEKVRFKVEVKNKGFSVENLGLTGADEVRFLFSSNPGIPLKPLEKIASGGELSRIFLACKSVLKNPEKFSEKITLIFDEVDAGIGGITAKKVAEKLKSLAGIYQIFCITHLPQIAIFADQHFLVEKLAEKNTTRTLFKELKGEEKLKEIARMLGDPENLELAKNFLKTS